MRRDRGPDNLSCAITRANAEDPLALVDELIALENAITTGLKALRGQLAS
ncbi:MAG: hypothetical protein J0M04_20585 [Verrucomicrobia bacterium]|nr:hypothetical protein [Verrucomicrobiota bacterium]